MFRARPPDADPESDEDSITTASTEASEEAENQEFPVKEILADKWSEVFQAPVYLVYWDGYPLDRATWEPASSFDEGREYIITDYLKSKGQREEFDWQKWDEDRERDALVKYERHKRRAAKKKRREKAAKPQAQQKKLKRGVAKPVTRPKRAAKRTTVDEVPDVDLTGFVVDDDDNDDDEDPDSDVPIIRRAMRKRRSIVVVSETEYPTESERVSDGDADSLMEDLAEDSAQLRTPRTKLRRADYDNGSLAAEHAGATDSAPLKASEAKVRRPIPKRRETSPHRGREPSPHRRRMTANIPPTQETAKVPMIYNKLSIRNMVQKKSKRDLAPPAELLQLFKPGEGGAISRPTKTVPVPVAQTPTIQEQPMQKQPTQKQPTQKQPTHKQPTQKQPIHKHPIQKGRRSPSPPATGSPGSPPAGPPKRKVKIQMNQIKLADETETYATFKCAVEYGPSLKAMRSLGTIKFLGFGTEFLAMLHDLQLEKMWISKTLEAKYLAERFIPVYGPPLEYVDMEFESESPELPGLLSVLSILQGAGMVVHKEFTLIVFQPSLEKLRNSFKVPQQRRKTALRAVLYPPVGVEVPIPQQDTPKPQKALDDGFDRYLSNLMFRHLKCYKDLLTTRKDSDSTDPKMVLSYCTTYCPEIAKPERLELENVLRLQGHRIFKIHDTPEIEKKSRQKKIHVVVFIHQSMRFHLHLLPHIDVLRNMNRVSFRMFGLRLDRGPDPSKKHLITVDERIWPFGSVILMTNRFLACHVSVVGQVLMYQKVKAASTKFCVASDFRDRLEAFAITLARLGGDPALGQEVLTITYRLESHIVSETSEDVISLELPERAAPPRFASPGMMDLEPGEIPAACNELELVAAAAERELDTEAEFENMIDMFALLHLEQATEHRRFIVCHSQSESAQAQDFQKLFPTITFVDPEKAVKELHPPGSARGTNFRNLRTAPITKK